MDDRDPEAFRSLYRANYRTVCRYLARRVDADRVEDLAAETFLVAWRRQAELPDHVVPWLLNSASKCLANARRADERADSLRRRLDTLTAAAGAASIEGELAREARRRALVAALATVADRDRELLLLRHWDGLAPREVARVLELSPVLARTRLHRAERRLQHALRDALEREDAVPVDLLPAGVS